MGRIAGALLNDGVTLGVSSRGMGSLVSRNGTNYVGEDFMLATAADIVADPSAPDAFVQGIMEGKRVDLGQWTSQRARNCRLHKAELNSLL